jgi:GT2 family glycosyltransferase
MKTALESDACASTSLGVSVVIPTHQRVSKLLRCIDSILSSDQGNIHLEVIVFSDRDPDAARAVAERFPAVTVIESQEKLGAHRGITLGARQSRGEFLFFLGDDNVVDPGCISALVRTLQADPSIGVLGPVSLRFGTDYEVWAAGGHLGRLGRCRLLYHGFQLSKIDLPEVIRCDYIPNACMVRRMLLECIERVAQLFPHNWSEQAVSREAEQLGLSTVVTSRALTWHDVDYAGLLTRTGQGWTADQARARIIYRRMYRPGFASRVGFWALVFPVSSAVYFWHLCLTPHPIREICEYLRGTWMGVRTPAKYRSYRGFLNYGTPRQHR